MKQKAVEYALRRVRPRLTHFAPETWKRVPPYIVIWDDGTLTLRLKIYGFAGLQNVNFCA